MIFTPRRHQEVMIEHALRWPRCAIWADMGLGKTTAMLYAFSCLDLVEPGPTLAIAPKRVAKSVWPGEVKKFSNLSGINVRPILGTAAERRAALLKTPRADIYTINYENLPWLMEECLSYKRWPFSKMIADESTRLKNFRLRGGGKRAAVMARIAHTHIRHWVELTGTPSPNGLIDLWGQMWFLDQGKRLGRTFTAFKERWFSLNYDGTISPRDNARQQIEFQLKDICLSVRAEDWFPVDKPIVTNIEVELPPAAMKQYRDMETKMFVEIAGKHLDAMSTATATLKCLQIANGACYLNPEEDAVLTRRGPREFVDVHSAKLIALESLYEELAGKPLIVAYHFKSDLARIKSKFPDALTLDDRYFPGGNVYKNVEEAWNAGKVRMLLMHPASAGHGLNLQDGGHHLVYFGHWWDLEQRMQILERIGPVRQKQSGYDRAVFVYNIVAKDTVDELVISRIEGKRELQDLLKEALAKRRQ